MESPLAECAKGGHFHVVTPLLESWALSQVAGTTVFLKCENVQPAGSFKIRGIGHFCQEAAKKGCRHLVCSSGGNAGLAAAYCARKLGIPATIVLPEGASQPVVKRLQGEGAEVQLVGMVWDEANLRAQELARRDGWVNVPPFDHPLIWDGHVSLVRELKAALGSPPGALVLAVGGGGLLAGVSAGLAEVGWQHVPIVAMETRGAHCFNAAVEAGRLVTLPSITRSARAGRLWGWRARMQLPGLLAPRGAGGHRQEGSFTRDSSRSLRVSAEGSAAGGGSVSCPSHQRVKQLPLVGVVTEAMAVRCRWKRRQAPTTENRAPPSLTSGARCSHGLHLPPSLPASLPALPPSMHHCPQVACAGHTVKGISYVFLKAETIVFGQFCNRCFSVHIV
uniref:L-serine deaminase n=1 Tax=Myotis myotis TaxID=51298 RepID=A0A7J7S3D3_MYOMY|nr:serine dehydratase like [Myotis myotis]